MSAAVPSLKQSLGAIIGRRFPWLLHVVTVAGAKGKGLAFRTASGLLHLAGGPDDPAVVRVGDAGTAGTIVLVGVPPAGTGFTITNAAGEVITFTFALTGGAVVVSCTQVEPFNLATKSTAGSDRVTCG